MIPFVDLGGGLVFLGGLFAGLFVLALLAVWLIGEGIRRRSFWRLALGVPPALYLTAVTLAAVRIIS